MVFDEMGGIWSPLVTLTGVIKEKNSDPIWMFDVEIDFPHLLGDSTDLMRKNDYITCVGPSALHALATFPKKHLSKLNRGAGLVGFDRKMSKLVAIRSIWQRLLKMDEDYLAKHSSKDSECSKNEAAHAKKGIKSSQKRIYEETAKIELLKAKGIVEPIYSADG